MRAVSVRAAQADKNEWKKFLKEVDDG